MVRQCVFPLCPNKMTSFSKFSFHRLPLDSPGLLNVWLVALKMDPNTEIEDLNRASHRVCSAHFAPEDCIHTKPKKKGQEPQRQDLKRSAIPIVSEGATDAVEVNLFFFCY
uniref:THAP domain-containing protein 1 n=1 Tax=Salarias fasciatus TaxID=181472 RepID=A0A672FQH8_SALFA